MNIVFDWNGFIAFLGKINKLSACSKVWEKGNKDNEIATSKPTLPIYIYVIFIGTIDFHLTTVFLWASLTNGYDTIEVRTQCSVAVKILYRSLKILAYDPDFRW